MKAVYYEAFRGSIRIEDVRSPVLPDDGVVIRVAATGLCRSDWHGWMGHDGDVRLPHVPGHEFAGVVEAVGREVARWNCGDRVTVPFACGCGRCPQCAAGCQHICDAYYQPGFTAWGAFAEYVAIPHADVNLVRLPDEVPFVDAASLGCRFTTAFRAVADQGRIGGGEWLAVFGCGGVGLSAVMLGAALGAQVLAVDIRPEPLALARECGAADTLCAAPGSDPVEELLERTGGGAHVTIDALGSAATCYQAISALRKRGRHVQVGLLLGDDLDPPLPMSAVIAKELQILGSHGLPARDYPRLFQMMAAGTLHPAKLVTDRIALSEVPGRLAAMDQFQELGIVVADRLAH